MGEILSRLCLPSSGIDPRRFRGEKNGIREMPQCARVEVLILSSRELQELGIVAVERIRGLFVGHLIGLIAPHARLQRLRNTEIRVHPCKSNLGRHRRQDDADHHPHRTETDCR